MAEYVRKIELIAHNTKSRSIKPDYDKGLPHGGVTSEVKEARDVYSDLNARLDSIETGVYSGVPPASFVVLGTHPLLTDERVLTGTANQITITDGGAGSTITLSIPQDIHVGASPTFDTLDITTNALFGGTLTLATGSITDSSGAISFGDDALSTTGTITGVNVTSGADPGHTHTAYQASDATLTSIALLGTAADRGIYTTNVDTWAEFTFTAAGRAILDDANAAAQATTLGLGTGDSPTWVSPTASTGFIGPQMGPSGDVDLLGLAVNELTVNGDTVVTGIVYVGQIGIAADTDLLVLEEQNLILNGDLESSEVMFDIKSDTADGADNKQIRIYAAGATSAARSARVVIKGNENASDPGTLNLQSGDDHEIFINAGTGVVEVTASSTNLSGDLLVDGGDIGITADTNLLQLATSVLTVNGTAVLTNNLRVDGGYIGLTADTDLIQLGVSVLTVNGTATITNNLRVDGGYIGLTADTNLIQIAANAVTINGTLNTTGLYTANGGITLGSSDDLTMNAGDIITDTSTGTKIAVAANQKLGFWGSTPVIQQAVTGSTPSGGMIDKILTALDTSGLIDDQVSRT